MEPKRKNKNRHDYQKQGAYDTEELSRSDIITESVSKQSGGIKQENSDSYPAKPCLKGFHSGHHIFLNLRFPYLALDYLYDHVPIFRRFVVGIKQQRGRFGRAFMAWVDWLNEEHSS